MNLDVSSPLFIVVVVFVCYRLLLCFAVCRLAGTFSTMACANRNARRCSATTRSHIRGKSTRRGSTLTGPHASKRVPNTCSKTTAHACVRVRQRKRYARAFFFIFFFLLHTCYLHLPCLTYITNGNEIVRLRISFSENFFLLRLDWQRRFEDRRTHFFLSGRIK